MLAMRTARQNNDWREAAAEMYRQGVAVRTICVMTDKHASDIYRALSRLGVALRGRTTNKSLPPAGDTTGADLTD